MALFVGACGGGVGDSASPQQPVPESPAAGSSLTVAPATASPRETGRPSVGQPADDGARVITVGRSGERIRDLTIDSPAVGLVTVRLLVPNGFDTTPAVRWPALYLLHGASGSSTAWTRETDVEDLTASSDLVVVMPDAGQSGFYSDWWMDGHGGPPMWETFHLTELPQILERNWRVGDRRAVAGLSMGGFGAMAYAARRPGMFLAAASYSGVLDPIGGQLDIGTDELWGDPVRQASVWRQHDPVNLAESLRGIALYVSYGNGRPGPFDKGSVDPDGLESWIAEQNVTFINRLNGLHIPVTIDAYGAGSHSWPYWQRALHRSFPLLMEALSP